MTRGQRIRLFRKRILGGWRQDDLAQAIGRSRTTIVQWEKDEPLADRAALALIAQLAEPESVAFEWLEGSVPGDLPPELRAKSSRTPASPPIRSGVRHGAIPQAPALDRLLHDVRGFELQGKLIDPRWMWERITQYARELGEEPPSNSGTDG